MLLSTLAAAISGMSLADPPEPPPRVHSAGRSAPAAWLEARSTGPLAGAARVEATADRRGRGCKACDRSMWAAEDSQCNLSAQ